MLKNANRKNLALEIIKKGSMPAFEQPSIEKNLGKVQHQFIAGPTQAAVPCVTKDVTIAVFSFVTFLECFLCLGWERLNCILRQYSDLFIQSVVNSLGLQHLEKTHCINFIEKHR